MKEFDEIGKRMPYAESDDYVSNLVDACADKAVSQSTISFRNRHNARIAYYVSVLAAVVAPVVITFSLFNNE